MSAFFNFALLGTAVSPRTHHTCRKMPVTTNDNTQLKMFVADTLMDGLESLASVADILNDYMPWTWRSIVAQDFTDEEILFALEELLSSGEVDSWLSTGGGLVQESAVAVLRTAAKYDPESVWFRLTPKGRRAVEAYDFPETFYKAALQYVQRSVASPASLISLYDHLKQNTNPQLTPIDYAYSLNKMLEIDDLRLWKAGDALTTDAPARIPTLQTGSKPDITSSATLKWTGLGIEWMGYSLTLGDEGIRATSSPREQELLIEISDPNVLVKKVIEQRPNYRALLTERKDVRHIVVDERNALTVGVGSIREFMAKSRWGKGLPTIDGRMIRHIVLDENGNVRDHYYGPASLDPLDAEL